MARPFDDTVVVEGGATRQESVAGGLRDVSADHVVVHDAARPFLSTDLLKRVLEGLAHYDGVVAAEPVEETLKRVDGDRVVETIDRSTLWRAQTPQAFRTPILKRAHDVARVNGIAGTDDAQLVESAGGAIRVVRGDRRNIKVTFEDDFAIAEAIAAQWP